MPVGLSFFTFHAVSYLADAYQGRATAKSGFIQGGAYLLLLPQFVGGPVTYQSLSGQLSRRADGVSDFAYGMRRLFIGMGKRVLIAQPCAVAANVTKKFGLPCERFHNARLEAPMATAA